MKSKRITISDSLPAVNLASCCLLGGEKRHLARCDLQGGSALPSPSAVLQKIEFRTWGRGGW